MAELGPPSSVFEEYLDKYAPDSERLAREIEILGKLGSGSFGAVFEGLHKVTGVKVALKTVNGEDDELESEIAMQGKQNAPNIIKYYGQFRRNAQTFLTMELAAVGSVTDLMRATGSTLQEPEIAIVLRGVLKALAYMHRARGVHRDIKTDNILMTAHGVPKLADFGVSRELGADESRMGTICGTPYYIAPEVLQEGAGYRENADIWSVGIAGIEVADGEPPHYEQHPMRVLYLIPNSPPPTVANRALWTPLFLDMLARCLVKDPASRPPAEALLEHPFIAGAGDDQTVMGPRIRRFFTEVHRAGSRKALTNTMKGKSLVNKARAAQAAPHKKATLAGLPPPPPPPGAPPATTDTLAAPVSSSSRSHSRSKKDKKDKKEKKEKKHRRKNKESRHRYRDDSDSDDGARSPSPRFIVDVSHGRPLIHDPTRPDGYVWFDPTASVWLRHPADDVATGVAGTADDFSLGASASTRFPSDDDESDDDGATPPPDLPFTVDADYDSRARKAKVMQEIKKTKGRRKRRK
jgi:serine/threonine protein kinase